MSDLSMLLSIGTVKHFPKNETVFMQHDVGDCMYIVMDGTFGVYINSFSDFPVRVAGIGQGLFFGEMSVIDGSPRSATIIAEDDCSALVIGKEHFETLLEKSPEIGATILSTLRERANTTSGAVRAAGKEPPPLPPLLRAVEYTDAKRGLSFMTMLAKYLRQMNSMLAKRPAAAPSAPAAVSDRSGVINLLPKGYKNFDIDDAFNSDELLAGGKVVCPYCKNEFHARFPNFSKLMQKETKLDQRIIFRGIDILWYTNIICPNCCYTDSYQEFNQGLKAERPKINGNQFQNAENFTGFESPVKHTLDEVIKSYYLRTVCVAPMTSDPLRMAKIWIRLYWLYSDNFATELAVQTAGKAFEYYLKYSQENEELLNSDEHIRTNAVLGELSCAMGLNSQAMEFFKKNAETPNVLIGSGIRDLVMESTRRYREIKRMM